MLQYLNVPVSRPFIGPPGYVELLHPSNFPGLEYRAVLISTVRSRHLAYDAMGKPDAGSNLGISDPASGGPADFGFLSEPKLLNTAMTRARSWLGVVGDPVALCSVGECSRIWRTYLKHCDRLESIRPAELSLDEIWLQVEGGARGGGHCGDGNEQEGK